LNRQRIPKIINYYIKKYFIGAFKYEFNKEFFFVSLLLIAIIVFFQKYFGPFAYFIPLILPIIFIFFNYLSKK